MAKDILFLVSGCGVAACIPACLFHDGVCLQSRCRCVRHLSTSILFGGSRVGRCLWVCTVDFYHRIWDSGARTTRHVDNSLARCLVVHGWRYILWLVLHAARQDCRLGLFCACHLDNLCSIVLCFSYWKGLPPCGGFVGLLQECEGTIAKLGEERQADGVEQGLNAFVRHVELIGCH